MISDIIILLPEEKMLRPNGNAANARGNDPRETGLLRNAKGHATLKVREQTVRLRLRDCCGARNQQHQLQYDRHRRDNGPSMLRSF